MRDSIHPVDLTRLGLSAERARVLAEFATALLRKYAQAREALWSGLRETLLRNPSTFPYEVHRFLFRMAFEGRRPEEGPAPVWSPPPEVIERSNLGKLMKERGTRSYEELHRWSTKHPEEFWQVVVEKTGIRFHKSPERVLDPSSGAERPRWFPGAQLNIVDSCFKSPANQVAILYGREGTEEIRSVTYGELERLANRVANGLDAMGLERRDRVALYMPMTPESVAIYLGVIRSGRAAVGIADTSAPAELAKRVSISEAKAIVTVDSYVRDGKQLHIYPKVIEAQGPPAIVLPMDGQPNAETPLRESDLEWGEFLSRDDRHASVARAPEDHTNILFSSGTTKDPKAIPWSQTTPIKSVADAYFHHDIHEDDVLAWPTSFGWMMGPWLTYSSLVLNAKMALFNGAPQRRPFGQFVERAGVTMLGVVPKLVKAWKLGRTMEGLNWSRIRVFSSTAEPSDPDEMLYLMHLAGYKPIIEYCGGTEIGGGYITGTVVQPASPGTFSTPSMGLDFHVLDAEGRPATRGEVALVPPSIGLSVNLLNYDHHKEYFAGFPRGPDGEVLRRHGDQLERLGHGYFRHHGRMDDMINLNGVKTSAEEIRHVIKHELVLDAKPFAVDVEGKGQHSLVVYAVPHDRTQIGSASLRERLKNDFQAAIKEQLNPLLAHVHDVVLVAELPQAGPGKTRTMKEFQADYQARAATGKPR